MMLQVIIMEEFSRTELLIKKEGLEKLQNSSVAVFGVGGVGGFVIEALVRAGIGTIHIVDHDTVSISNLNRQIIATHQTIDRKKVHLQSFFGIAYILRQKYNI